MLSELKTLVAVSRFGTFAAAGDRIGLTQAAVSGQMKRLEDHLGLSLFERTGRSARLNADGLRVLEKARTIIALFDALADPVDDPMQGQLRIGAIASVQSTILARALVPFRARFPGHRIHIIPGISLDLLDRLDAGDLDLAIVIKPSYGVPKEFVWEPLINEPYILAVPAGIVGEDWASILQEQPFIRYERGSFGGRQVDRFLRSQALMVQDSIEADDLPTMLALVGKGLGVALLPMTEANLPLPPQVRGVSLGATKLTREIGILRLPNGDTATSFLKECLRGAPR